MMLLPLTLGLLSLSSPFSSPITPQTKYAFLPPPPIMATSQFTALEFSGSQDINDNTPFDISSEKQEKEKEMDRSVTSDVKAVKVCVDYTIDGHYDDRKFQDCQAKGFVRRPATISACELAQLHQDCVDRINMYRSGQLGFSNGQQDALVVSGINPLNHRKGSNQCSSEAAMGDLIANYQGGGACAGAHTNAFVCGGGAVGQNSCCASGDGSWGWWDSEKFDTYDKVKGELFNCLQSMWDEGETGSGGHWQNMRNPNYAHVSCGFAWSEKGRVMMTQDFTSAAAMCTPSCPACGASDSCSLNACVCQGSTADQTVSAGSGHCSESSGSRANLSTGAKVAIAVVVIATVVATAIGVFWYRNRKVIDAKLRRMKRSFDPRSNKPTQGTIVTPRKSTATTPDTVATYVNSRKSTAPVIMYPTLNSFKTTSNPQPKPETQPAVTVIATQPDTSVSWRDRISYIFPLKKSEEDDMEKEIQKRNQANIKKTHVQPTLAQQKQQTQQQQQAKSTVSVSAIRVKFGG